MSPPLKTKVCLFSLPSRYEVGSAFIHQLAHGFQELGVEVSLLDLLGDDFIAKLTPLLSDPPDFCLSLNALSTEFQVEGKGIHELLGSPLIGLYIDDPLIASNTYRLSMQNHIATSVSPRLAKLVSARFALPSITFYHGVLATYKELPRKRPIDLIFAGTYQPPKALRERWEETLPSRLCGQIEALIELAKSEEERPIWEVWQGMKGDPSLIDEQVVIPHAEGFIRHFRRDKLLEMAAKGGHVVTLVGEGWESCPYSAFHTLLGPLPYPSLIELMSKAKVALHITPLFCAGSHERPLIAMEKACAVLVDGSPFFRDHFNLPSYSWKEPEGIIDKIGEALQDWEELGREGKRIVQSAHTWKHRALELLNTLYASF